MIWVVRGGGSGGTEQSCVPVKRIDVRLLIVQLPTNVALASS